MDGSMTKSNQGLARGIDALLAAQGWHTQDQHSVRSTYNRLMSSTESGEGVHLRKSFEVSYA